MQVSHSQKDDTLQKQQRQLQCQWISMDVTIRPTITVSILTLPLGTVSL